MPILKSFRAHVVAIAMLAIGGQAQAAADCAEWQADFDRLQQQGLTGESLLRVLNNQYQGAQDCRQWLLLSARGWSELDDWETAASDLTTARDLHHPETFALLANAHWRISLTEDKPQYRNIAVSEAAANGDIALKQYRKLNQTPPDWFNRLLLEIDNYGAVADAQYYQEVLAAAVQQTRGSDIVPAINVQIHFDTARWDLKPAADAKVNEIAAAINTFLQSNPGTQFRVIGHTDIVGGESSNMVLSEKRANTVVTRLKSLATAAEFEAIGMGESNPRHLGPETDDFINTANRRVEIEIK